MANKHIKYCGENKRKIRDYFVLPSIIKSQSFFEFYGNGEHYGQIKENPKLREINHMCIDSDKRKAKLLRAPDTRCISFIDYCKSVGDQLPEEKRFGTIWLDYCASYQCGFYVNNDLRASVSIMRQKGELFITLQRGREGSGKSNKPRDYEYAGLTKGATRSQIESWMISHICPIMAREAILITKIDRVDYASIPEYADRKKKSQTAMMVYKLTWKRLKKPTDRPIDFSLRGINVISLDTFK